MAQMELFHGFEDEAMLRFSPAGAAWRIKRIRANCFAFVCSLPPSPLLHLTCSPDPSCCKQSWSRCCR